MSAKNPPQTAHAHSTHSNAPVQQRFDFHALFFAFEQTALAKWLPDLSARLTTIFIDKPHGDTQKWLTALENLPAINATTDCNNGHITLSSSSLKTAAPQTTATIEQTLQQLHPWRKGPFDFFGTRITTEWHSDWKWQRLQPHIKPLKNKRVLDVGCGNGYHCWRMHGEGAGLVVGIDPSPLFFYQFQSVKKYNPQAPVFHVPVKLEDMPFELNCFDTVFSMGVLYHRKSPFEHLERLKNKLKAGGELVLETLVIDGDAHTVLVPEHRYAQMNNVYFIPSTAALEGWLKKVGFTNIRTVDINQTSTEEQRSTEWMTWQSLSDFLDPNDNSRTIEGYPAPKRAIIIADKPLAKKSANNTAQKNAHG